MATRAGKEAAMQAHVQVACYRWPVGGVVLVGCMTGCVLVSMMKCVMGCGLHHA